MDQLIAWIGVHKLIINIFSIIPWFTCLSLALLPLLRSAVWTYRQNREHSHRLYSGDGDYWEACEKADRTYGGLRSLICHARGYIMLKGKLATDYRQRIRRCEHREPAQYRRPWLKPLVIAAVIGLLATVGVHALINGVDAGFIRTVPTADPGGSSEGQVDTRAFASKIIAPLGSTGITSILWYCDNATEEANFQVGIYSHDEANNRPDVLLASSLDIAKGTNAGWKATTVSYAISPGTIYWIAMQLDDTATTTNMPYQSGVGGVSNYKSSQTQLPSSWGSSSGSSAYLLAICAVYTYVQTDRYVRVDAIGTGGSSITFATALTQILAGQSGNVNKTGDVYDFLNREGATAFTITIAASSRTRS